MPDDANNLGAQNNKKPPASFNLHHQVVEYNGRIYDPSYGKDFDDVEDWKEKSIDGVCIDGEMEDLPDGTKAKTWLIRKQ